MRRVLVGDDKGKVFIARSSTLGVFIGAGRSAPASTAPAAADPAAAGGLPVTPAEESVPRQAQAKPILATATDAPTPTSRQAKRTHPASFEVVSAPKTFSFEVVAPRN